jgi:hypothetical protein
MRRALSRICVLFVLALALAIHCSYALDLPNDALQLLAETTVDPCTICAKQKLKKAFKIMNDRFTPGLVMKSDDSCRLMKSGAGDDNEISLTCYPSNTLFKSIKEGEKLPRIIFTFYTPQKRLVGISDNDYTDKPTADLYHASRLGTVFEGRIKLIPYKYGDGPTYNYFQKTNTLQIHCVVLQLNPATH